MMFKYTPTKENISILLTKLALISLGLASFIMLFIGPWITRLVIEHRSPLFQDSIRFWVLLLLGYVLGALAISCIITLYQLITRIGNNHVFVSENVQSLRYLGWIVGAVALISLFMGLTAYLPMLLVAVSCSLLTLIIRVIRNAFGKAVALQEEVDFTI
ncbi:DUF2975 domain-containing protein [Streptococcus pluranimalium]|uniref:DUF2975 domain-containing protein n=1 Tax=Streptococcus pluranimalium TaxID=82348 RepID=UPI00387EBE7E